MFDLIYRKNWQKLLSNRKKYDMILNVMAELVKWLTHWIVVPTCMGSIPIFRPIMLLED